MTCFLKRASGCTLASRTASNDNRSDSPYLVERVYLCICSAVTETQVRNCVRHGAYTLSDLQMQLGIACQCGVCASMALTIIEEETGRSATDPHRFFIENA
jgi:bacterioferritin-associated ferredoxin